VKLDESKKARGLVDRETTKPTKAEKFKDGAKTALGALTITAVYFGVVGMLLWPVVDAASPI